jgi:hypothetical protein
MKSEDAIYRLGIMLAANKAALSENNGAGYGKPVNAFLCREAQAIRRQMQEA